MDEIAEKAQTTIADFLGDVKDGYPGRRLDAGNYATCLRPLAQSLIDELRNAGLAIVRAK